MENFKHLYWRSKWKSILVKDQQVWLFDDFLAADKCQEAIEGKIFLTKTKMISFKDIQKISFNEASESFRLHYLNSSGVLRSLSFVFPNEEESNGFAHYLANEVKMDKIVEGENRVMFLGFSFFNVAIIAGLTWFVANEVRLIQQNSADYSEQMIQWATAIGEIGIYIIGAIMAIILLVFALKRYNHPPSEISYIKNKQLEG